MFDVFTNEKTVQEFVKQDRSLAQRVLDRVKTLIADIRNIYNKLIAQGYDEIAALRDELKTLEKIRDLFFEALDETAPAANQEQKNTAEIITAGDLKFSKNESFEKQVDDAINGKLNRRNALYVSDTPEILLDIGMKQLPMLYTQKHLKDAMKPKSDNNAHYHGLTKEQILEMPDIIEKPAIIMDSISRSDSIVLVSDVLDNDGAPIIMSIIANGEGVYELENVKSNFISSYYGKDNGFEDFIDRTLADDKILYISKEKSHSLYQQTGLQLPGGFNKLGFNKIIHQSNNIVNNNSMQKGSKNTPVKFSQKLKSNLDPDGVRTPGKRLVESDLTKEGGLNYNFEEHDPLSFDDRAMPNSKSSINWVYKAEIFSNVENKMFHQKLAEIRQGSEAFVQTDEGYYIVPIENKLVFTDGDFNRPYIDRIVEVLVETQTRFDMAKEIIYDVEAGRQGIREASRTLQNFQGEGAVLQYTGRDNRPYGWADRKPKGRNRRAAINNYINQQIRKRNASKSSTNQSIIPSAKPTNPIREEVSDYINNRSDMQAIYKTIDKRYRLAGKKKLNEKSIESFANKILSQTHSKYSKELLTERLTALFLL